jgi:phage repressor protein C with HTH and peptisase S24 domain/DNA-binding phage protein
MSTELKLAAGIVARLKKAAERKGWRHAEIAAASGIPVGTVQKLMRGATDPQFTTMQRVVESLGISMDYVLTGIGDESGDWESALPQLSRDQTRIPIYDVTVSAGDGREVLREEPVSWATFPTHYVKSLGEADTLQIVTVEGDSMEPDLRSGDQVMFDAAQAQPRDGLFVIRLDAQLHVKRLRILSGGKVELMSSNPAYGPIVVDLSTDDFEIKGRIKWKGNAI